MKLVFSHCAGVVPPAGHLLSQAGIGILLYTHDVAWYPIANRNKSKPAIFHCEGMVPLADHLLRQAGIGILLYMHNGTWYPVANRNTRKPVIFHCGAWSRLPTIC